MQQTYFSELRTDLQHFKLVNTPAEPISYDEVHALYIENTTFIGSELIDSQPSDLRKKMKTRLGRQIRTLLQNNIVFGEDQADIGVCDEAEWRLVANTHIAAVAESAYDSPIIVTDQHRPVGIIKGYGEPSFYALATDMKRGLVAQTFGSVASHPYLLRANTAWTIPLDFIGTVCPVRFSQFAIPTGARKNLTATANQQCTLTVSHEELVQRAYTLLRTARPLIPTLGSSATTYRPPAGFQRAG